MSIDLEQLVHPSDYDEQLYDLVHNVLDRTIELASQIDQTDDDDDEEDEPDGEALVSTIRSQANFTPAEQNEFKLTGTLLNVLMGVCISRRSGLYHQTHDHPALHPTYPDHPPS